VLTPTQAVTRVSVVPEPQERDGTALIEIGFLNAEVSITNHSTIFVGLDVHKDSIVAAHSVGFGEVQSLGNVGVRDRDMDRLCTRMQSKAPEVRFVYEAGPCGYGLQRHLSRKGYECQVCAPSLIACKPGDRVKTDRRVPRNGFGRCAWTIWPSYTSQTNAMKLFEIWSGLGARQRCQAP